MIVIEPITLQHLATFKATRLRALQDTPTAFGSTYEREIQLTDEDWRNRIIRWGGDACIGFLAMDEGTACGLAGSFLDPDDITRAHLISMWTAPLHRQHGVGRMLVNAVAVSAHRRGATVLRLLVTSTNDLALLFYQRLGFVSTGRSVPHPNDPKLVEHEMERSLP